MHSEHVVNPLLCAGMQSSSYHLQVLWLALMVETKFARSLSDYKLQGIYISIDRFMLLVFIYLVDYKGDI